MNKTSYKAILKTSLTSVFFISSFARADVIVDEYPDDFGGPITCLGAGNDSANLMLGTADCMSAGGLVMTQFGDDPNTPGTLVTSVDSPIEGTVHFLVEGGTDPTTDSLQMIVGDPDELLPSLDPDWWQYSDHGSVYMTHVNWIELLFDTTAPVRGFSTFVGADFTGRGWIQGFDDQGNDTIEYFSVSAGDSPGFGVYGSAGSCSTITRVIVEPYHLWGVGNFAINQDPCVSVPEPSSLALLGLGLIGLGVFRRRNTA